MVSSVKRIAYIPPDLRGERPKRPLYAVMVGDDGWRDLYEEWRWHGFPKLLRLPREERAFIQSRHGQQFVEVEWDPNFGALDPPMGDGTTFKPEDFEDEEDEDVW